MCALQWVHVGHHHPPLWCTSRFRARSGRFYSLLCWRHQDCFKARLQGPLICRWRTTLRPCCGQQLCNIGPRMSACVLEINEWMASNRLKLNPAKTEIIWLGSARKLKHCPMDELSIAGVMLRPSTQVRDLGVQVDNNLSMSTHINHVTRTCFYHIRQLRTVRRSLTVDTTHALVRALVHSRLDYCNSVLAGQPKYCFDNFNRCFVLLLDLYCVYQAGRMSVRSSVDNCTGCHSRKSAVQAVHSCVQVPPSTGASVFEWTVCACFHAPRQISSTIGCHWWPTCSSDSNKNNWSAWFFLIWSIRMEQAAYWHEEWNTLFELFQGKTQNFSVCVK